jgi:hypothetical protein
MVAGCLTAVYQGCAVISDATFSKDERTGNARLEALLTHRISMGYFADAKPDFTAFNAPLISTRRWISSSHSSTLSTGAPHAGRRPC